MPTNPEIPVPANPMEAPLPAFVLADARVRLAWDAGWNGGRTYRFTQRHPEVRWKAAYEYAQGEVRRLAYFAGRAAEGDTEAAKYLSKVARQARQAYPDQPAA